MDGRRYANEWAAGDEPWIGVRADWPLRGANPLDQLVSVTPSDLATHGLILGATGSGKTTCLHHLIAQDLQRGHSLVVLDYRGDLVSAALELCSRCVPPERVKVIDLREKVRPFGFNPLLGAGEPYFRALGVLDALEHEAESWGVQLAETLRNGLLLLAECGGTLLKLERLFYDTAFLETCLRQARTDGLVAFWSRFLDLSRDKQTALASPVLNKVSLLIATPALRAMLGHPDPIDLRRHLDTPGSVLLVSLAVDETHGAGRMLGNLVLSAITREIFGRVSRAESSRNPVRIIVDEFEHFSAREFEHLLAEGRRFKCSLILANQVLAQLNPRVRSMLLNNVGFKAFFRTGREDSSALSRDLFGDKRAYDFTDLPTGYCVCWQKEKGVIELEVNEPLLSRVGELSNGAAQYRQAVFSQTRIVPAPLPIPPGPRSLPATVKHQSVTIEPARVVLPAPSAEKEVPRGLVVDLEDWLCG